MPNAYPKAIIITIVSIIASMVLAVYESFSPIADRAFNEKLKTIIPITVLSAVLLMGIISST